MGDSDRSSRSVMEDVTKSQQAVKIRLRSAHSAIARNRARLRLWRYSGARRKSSPGGGGAVLKPKLYSVRFGFGPPAFPKAIRGCRAKVRGR